MSDLIDYLAFLGSLKERIYSARQHALLSANAEQIRLYFDIGSEILQRQTQQGWGAKVINRLSTDLKMAFPEMKGFSSTNLKYMKVFAQECPDMQIGQQSADQLPWFHIVVLLTKIPDTKLRGWYALQAVQNNWVRDTLESQIKTQLHLRLGAAPSNFQKSLPELQAGIAQQILKDPYHLDFLGLTQEAAERDIENALVQHITKFLLELGAGFAFVARQYRLEVDGDEFFIDLLFYHIHLKCYVVIELKATAFKPEHAGQLNFYLAAVDAQLKTPEDKPTIGLLLCKTKKNLIVEYALSGMEKPMGVAEYQLLNALPSTLEPFLPSVEQLERGLATLSQSHLGQNL